MSFGQKLSRIVASGFGSGFLSRAPGTIGSISFLILWVVIHSCGVESTVISDLLIAISVAGGGFAATGVVLREEAEEDPGWIVVDEWAGMAVALIGTSAHDYVGLTLALVTFRVFDILKPGLVGRAEALPGAAGVMADDVVAGVFALLIVRLCLFF